MLLSVYDCMTEQSQEESSEDKSRPKRSHRQYAKKTREYVEYRFSHHKSSTVESPTF
jgi:hypothetical protein